VELLLTDVALRWIDEYELLERANALNPRLQPVVMARLTGPAIDELISIRGRAESNCTIPYRALAFA
jgi:hypothetical protein